MSNSPASGPGTPAHAPNNSPASGPDQPRQTQRPAEPALTSRHCCPNDSNGYSAVVERARPTTATAQRSRPDNSNAQTRGEGIFLRFSEERLAEWERRADVMERGRVLRAAHEKWRADRRLSPGSFPGVRYLLLHTFAHALIREFALECGYSASGIAERVYAQAGEQPMAGIMLYTAAPDSEGTLGGLVSLGRRDRLGGLIAQALDVARLCTSDPLCADHDPRDRGDLFGAACHACLFAAETSCERGNHYLDRTLLVDTVTGSGCGFLAR